MKGDFAFGTSTHGPFTVGADSRIPSAQVNTTVPLACETWIRSHRTVTANVQLAVCSPLTAAQLTCVTPSGKKLPGAGVQFAGNGDPQSVWASTVKFTTPPVGVEQ